MATINDVAAMHLLRAASEVLQKHWGDGDDPLAWKGVEWSEQLGARYRSHLCRQR